MTRHAPQLELVLRIQAVPRPLWRQNLRAALGDHEWRKLRQRLLAERGRDCETCGVSVPPDARIHAHEEWAYDTSAVPAVARIVRIAFICVLCHGCEHFMRLSAVARHDASAAAALPRVVRHWCNVNTRRSHDFEKHLAEAAKEWLRMSALRWAPVDFGPYAPLVAEAVAARKEREAQRLIREREMAECMAELEAELAAERAQRRAERRREREEEKLRLVVQPSTRPKREWRWRREADRRQERARRNRRRAAPPDRASGIWLE